MILSLLLSVWTAGPPEASPSPSPSPAASPAPALPPDPDASYHAWVGAERAYTPESANSNGVAGIEADAPLVFGPVRLRLRVGLTVAALPGTSAIAIDRPETWSQSATFEATTYRAVGVVGKHATSLVAAWGFSTALEGRVLERYAYHLGLGALVENVERHSRLVVLLEPHDARAKGGHGWQAELTGLYPLGPGPAGAVLMLRGQALLPLHGGGSVMRLGVVAYR